MATTNPAFPDNSSVRAALERILASECFASAQRHRDFLRYIVEETLAGRGERLKGYTIAVEVLERPEDFDAQNDPYVRVEAGRLRKRLAEYYLTEGEQESVRIRLNRGTYEPEFVSNTADETADDEVSVAANAAEFRTQRPISRSRIFGAIAILVLIALALPFTVDRLSDDALSSEQTRHVTSLAVRPFENLSEPEFDSFSAGLTEEIMVLLTRYDPVWGAIRIFGEQDALAANVTPASDFVLTGTFATVGDVVRVTSRILDTEAGRQIWSHSFDDSLADHDVFEIRDLIAARIVDVVRDTHGPITVEQYSQVSQLPLEDLVQSDCYLLFQAALRTMAESEHDRAQACVDRFRNESSPDARIWAVQSLLSYWDHENGRDLRDGLDSALDEAYAAAQRALDTDGNLASPHMALAFVNSARGQNERALDSIARLLSLNPPPSIRAHAEALKLRLDAPDASLEEFDRCLAEVYQTVPYVFVGPTYFYLRQQDYQSALRMAERIDAPEFTMAQVFWTALSALTGQTERASRHLAILLEMHPKFEDYGVELIARWSSERRIRDSLVAGLELAGLNLD